MAAHSPASSPRLPSPPPMAEDQTMPTSPGVSLFEEHGKFPGSTTDNGASRRIRPGTKADEMAEGPPLVDLQDIDSAFQLTEHLQALHYHHTHPPSTHTTAPLTAAIARQLAQPPPNTATEIWLYELARFLIQKTNAIIVALFADAPPCSPHTCPEMRASEWQYLCAVHDPPKSCSAVDYCCHTLDWAATTLTSSKMFPSRLGLGSGAAGGGGGGGDKVLQQQMKEITNIFRRVYRIYAHAWFQHREMFWRVEGKTGLYVFFKTVCDEYGMIQAENYTIPPEAEHLESAAAAEYGVGGDEGGRQAPMTLLRKGEQEGAGLGLSNERPEPMGNTILAAGDTTKRHRHTLSDRGNSVTTVIQEEVEEEEEEEGEEAQAYEQQQQQQDLERQASNLRDFAESLPQPGRQQQQDSGEEAGEVGAEEGNEGEEPMVGVGRSNTLKPAREVGEEEPAGDEEEEGDATVIEPEAESKGEEEGSAPEPVEPSEAPAAEAGEAGNSVAD